MCVLNKGWVWRLDKYNIRIPEALLNMHNIPIHSIYLIIYAFYLDSFTSAGEILCIFYKNNMTLSCFIGILYFLSSRMRGGGVRWGGLLNSGGLTVAYGLPLYNLVARGRLWIKIKFLSVRLLETWLGLFVASLLKLVMLCVVWAKKSLKGGG